MGLDVADSADRFKEELPRIVAMLQGRDLGDLAGDPALDRCRSNPVPVLVGAMSVAASKRAALVGAGILLEAMSERRKLVQRCEAFDGAGGTMPKVLIRRVWLGEPPTELLAELRRVFHRDERMANTMQEDLTIATPDPVAMAEELVDLWAGTGVDAINLQLHLPGTPPEAVREQVAGLASDVLPRIRVRRHSYGGRPAVP
jgi:hypothetical protein